MKAFLIYAESESHRKDHIAKLMAEAPFAVEKVEAVYPDRQHVPFRDALLRVSKERTGKTLLMGELGCLLSHRRVWTKILSETKNDQDHFLVFESDSLIEDAHFLRDHYSSLTETKDLFFWGAWEGHMKFFQSTQKAVNDSYVVGEPFIKTIYCTYGYSLNRKAAKLLLSRTRKISHPVDQFKYFFSQKELELGGVLPEVITGNKINSTIRGKENALFKQMFLSVLDLKNNIICSLR